MVDYLGDFLMGYMWVDDEWLIRDETECTYWQHRLAQHIRFSELPDGRLHWQIDTLVVQDVENASMANELCMELNNSTAGWSFAYDNETRAIFALCSMTASPYWDRYLLRLAEAAKLSAWMSDRITAKLASEVGGVPAYSHPDPQVGLRETPDAIYSYMDVVRERPEWIFDTTAFMYPEPDKIANHFSTRMRFTADSVEVNDPDIWITTLTEDGQSESHFVHAGFIRSPLYGSVWVSEITFPGTETLAAPEQIRSLVWEQFLSPGLSLLGSWVAREGSLVYSQNTLTSSLRSFEQLQSFQKRDDQLLWSIASNLSDAIGLVVPATKELEEMRAPQRVGRDIRLAVTARVLGTFQEEEQLYLQLIPTIQGEHADRRILWMRPVSRLLTAIWFNPNGPTLSTLELCIGSEGLGRYLVEYMRHPFFPSYCVLARCDTDQEFLQALPGALESLLVGSLPNVLTMHECPVVYEVAVHEAARSRIREVASELDLDLVFEAAMLVETHGRPWEWVTQPTPSPESVAIVKSASSDTYEAWFAQASHINNYVSVMGALSGAWDGSLNFQMSLGNFANGSFDTGPLFLTYDKVIGWQKSEPPA